MAKCFFALLLAELLWFSNGLTCYNHVSVSCEEPSDIQKLLCDQLAEHSSGNNNSTAACEEGMDFCADGELAFKATDGLDVAVSFASCGVGEAGCFDDLEELDAKLGSDMSTVLQTLETTLNVESSRVCFCDMGKCNSALGFMAHTPVIVILLSVSLVLFY